MEKLKEKAKALLEKIKSLKKPVKIVLAIAIFSVVIGLISLVVISNKNKYAVLYSNLEDTDAQTVTDKLKADKIDYKIEGNQILVPKNSVDELRLELAPSITGGSIGYELMDSQSSFGMTDEEFKLKKQRMLEGELEKTIKSFDSVENARVHITPAVDSVFVKDKEPGSAAVVLKLKNGRKLDDNQVKSIISLVSSGDIPKENIEVVDQDMNLLSEGVFDGQADEQGGIVADSNSVDKQRQLEENYEKALEKNINDLLEPVIGKNKVKAKVSVDMDFDSTQKTVVTVDPNKVIKNQKTIKQNSGLSNGTLSQSPVDNNMSNTIDDKDGNNTSINEQQETEYEIGKTEIKNISAPGEVKRLTASVIIDGNLDQAGTNAIKELVSTAIGFNSDRNDQISVAGMAFDMTADKELQDQINAMNEEEAKSRRMKLYAILAISILGLIFILTLIFILLKKKKKEDNDEVSLDKVIGDDFDKQEVQAFKPIEFEGHSEELHVEEQVKKYAQEKPEQVVDVIKSWLKESER